MPQYAQPLNEVATSLIPKEWADSPQERAKQLNQIQNYLAEEAVVDLEEEREQFGVLRGRAVFASQVGAYYTRTTGPVCDFVWEKIQWVKNQITGWITKQIVDPIVNTLDRWADMVIGGLDDFVFWLYSGIETVWNFVNDVAGSIRGLAENMGIPGRAGIGSLVYWIWDFFKDASGAIQDAVSGFWETLWEELDTIGETLGNIPSEVEEELDVITESFWNTFVSTLKPVLNTALSGIWGAGQEILGKGWKTLKEAFSWVYGKLRDSWNALDNIGTIIFNQAKGALENVIDPLWGILENIKTLIGDISDFFTAPGDVFSSSLTDFWEWLKGVGSAIKDFFGTITEPQRENWLGYIGWKADIEETKTNHFASMVTSIKEIPQKIWNALKQLGGWIYEGLETAIETIQDKLWPAIQSGLDAMWHGLQSGINWLFTKIFDTVHWVMDKATNFAHIVTDALIQSTKGILTATAGQFANFFDWTITELVISPLRELRGEGGTIPGIPQFVDTIGEVSEEMYETLRDGVLYEPPATPEKAEDAAGDFLSYGLVFGGMDSMMSMVEEVGGYLRGWATNQLTNYTNWVQSVVDPTPDAAKRLRPLAANAKETFPGIAKFFKSTYYALGLGFMMWTIWSGTLRAAMSDPREDFYRRYYKTRYPRTQEFMDAFKAQMTLPTSNEGWLDAGGFSPMYRDMVKQTAWNRLSKSQIEKWYERGYINDEEIWEYVKWLGYKPEVAKWIEEDIKQEARSDKHDDIAKEIQDAYQEGLFPREKAKSWLQSHGYNGPVAEWYTHAIDIETEVEDAQEFIDAVDDKYDDKLDLLAERFEDGEISESEFIERRNQMEHNYESALTKYMTRQDRVEAKMNQWKWSNLPEQWLYEISPIEDKIDDLEQELQNKKSRRKYLVNRRKEERETYEAEAKVIKERMSVDARELQREIENTREEMIRELRAERADYADDVADAVEAASEELARSLTQPWTTVVNQIQVNPEPEIPAPDISMDAVLAALEAQEPALTEQIRTDIANIKDEHKSEIKTLQAELEDLEPVRAARLQRLREDNEDTMLYYDRRISDLEGEIKNIRDKLEAAQRATGVAG